MLLANPGPPKAIGAALPPARPTDFFAVFSEIGIIGHLRLAQARVDRVVEVPHPDLESLRAPEVRGVLSDIVASMHSALLAGKRNNDQPDAIECGDFVVARRVRREHDGERVKRCPSARPPLLFRRGHPGF